MIFKRVLWSGLIIYGFMMASVRAQDSAQLQVTEQLSATFPNARIEITSPLAKEDLPVLRSVKIMSVMPKGEAIVQYELAWDEDSKSIFKNQLVKFNAWLEAPVAIRRINQGERLSADLFKNTEVNVAMGLGYEYRGVIASTKTDFAGLEAKNTLLEGQFLISSALQKSPEIRRGDLVKVELMSGDLTLGTQAVAQEPGFVGQNLRILVTKTKKELIGKLKSNNVVEVNL